MGSTDGKKVQKLKKSLNCQRENNFWFMPATKFLYDLSKMPIDNAPGASASAFHPRCCGDPMIDRTKSHTKIQKSFFKK
jgi:hypothetical protein